MNYIKRDIEATILEAARYFPVITVTGPRQSGKTTIQGHAFPHIHYYSLEDLDTRDFAKKDPVRFLHFLTPGEWSYILALWRIGMGKYNS